VPTTCAAGAGSTACNRESAGTSLPAREPTGRRRHPGEFQDILAILCKDGKQLSNCSIVGDVEMISIKTVNEAYARLLKNDVKYRFVIDMATPEGNAG
jgi:hypothetical protein